jgi:D-methionine transport system ATP-binding protein
MKIIDKICNKVSIISNSEIVESGYVHDIFKNPKSSIARELILPMESFKINSNKDTKYLRLVFDGTVDEPIISNLILSCNCQLSILSSSVRKYDDKAYGQMIIQVPSEDEVYKSIINFLNKKKILVEEVDDSGLDTDIRID